VLVNFAMHPDVIGGGNADFISGDWPGLMSNTLSAVYGDDMVTLLLQGTCGDINHRPHDKTALPTGGPAKAEQLGRALAGATMVALERAEPMSDARLAVAHKVLELPYYTRDEAIYKEMEALEKKEKLSIMEEANIRRVRDWPHDGKTTNVPIQTMRIGEVGLAAFPAEIFVRLGLEVKEWSQAPRTFVVELANDRVSTYVPDTDHADRGAYGQRPILSRWLASDAGRHMADAAIDMLYGLFPKE
jgi:neutral ceramidase